MKVVFVAPINCIHVTRWANSMVKKVEKVHILTMHEQSHFLSNEIVVHKLRYKAPLGYILNKFNVQRLIKKISPDVIHVHQISGHGTLMAISNIDGYLLSIYGADVYSFPKKSFLNRILIKYNLKRASYLASTSNAMATETKKYTKKNIYISPFGVDIQKFDNKRIPQLKNKHINIGIVKSLREKYGLEYLIRAVPILKEKLRDDGIKMQIKVFIYGKGYLKQKLAKLASSLKIYNIYLPGFVSNEKVPEILNTFDIVCIPSISDSESFGVSAVEAMACERPIVVSDVDGLKEVVVNNSTGIVVQRKNSEAIANAIMFLIKNPEKALEYGLNGRRRVKELYDWDRNVQMMYDIYTTIKRPNLKKL